MNSLDDKDAFTSVEELKADMELASMKGFIEDILLGHVWFNGIGAMGRHGFVKFQIHQYTKDLDRALDLLVWNAGR